MALNEFIDTTPTIVVAIMVTVFSLVMMYGELDELLSHWKRKRL
jgi:hypothetical protein